MGASTDTARIDLDTNPWDQATFMGELQTPDVSSDNDNKTDNNNSRPVPIFRLDVQPHERAGGQPDPGGGQAAAGAVQGGHGAPGHHGDTGDT